MLGSANLGPSVYLVFSKNTKNTNGPKFADPRVAAVSPYFKRSMSGRQFQAAGPAYAKARSPNLESVRGTT